MRTTRCMFVAIATGVFAAGAVSGAAKLPRDPRPSETSAAEEYAAWTAKLTGGKAPELEIVRDDTLGEDGFRLRNAGGKLVVSGGRRGVLYGVYDALERFGGIEWLSINTTVIPEKGTLKLPEGLDEVQKPAFELRQPLWYDAMQNPDLAARMKLNSSQLQERHGGCSHLFDTKLRNCHTFEWLVPQSEYWEKHPEYYSEWEGKRRKGRTQLCLTNPDVLRIVTEKVLKRIEENPKAKYFGVSQNDWGFYCTCAKCAAIDAEEESHAGTVVRFVNAIAEEVGKKHPDKVIETLAYQWSRKPPKKTRLRKNVMPCLCSIECEFKNPLATSKYEANKSFMADLRGWAAQTDQLYVWDYTTDFADYLYPFPNVHVLRENIRTFRDNKVKSLFEQGAYQGRHADFAELKTWLIAKWMWNPELPEEELLERFFIGYYGAAAKVVRKYFDELHAIPRDGAIGNPLGIYESAYSPLTPDAFLERAAAMWDEAERLVKDDPVRSYNVRMGRLPVDATRLLRHRGAAKRWPEYRALAKRVLAAFEEAKEIRFSETKKQDPEILSDWKKIAACETFEEASKDLSFDVYGRKDLVIAMDRFLFEEGKAYTLRVHACGGFKAGVDDWDSVQNHGRIEVGTEKPEWAWHDVLTWQVRNGEYFWFTPLDEKTEIEKVELVPAPAAYPLKQEIWPKGKIPMKDYTGYAPYYYWYDPTNRTTDTILITCSGGGYWFCSTGGFETVPVIDYMLARGVTCVEFRYRPRAKGYPKHLAAWQDAQRMIRIVRHEARRRGMDTERIGFTGGSAGGHLTILSAVSSTTNAYELIGDEIDQEPCHLNFAIPVYPAYGMSDVPDGCARSDDLSIPIVSELLFDQKTPPMCFFHGESDSWTPMTSLRCWHKMRLIRKSCELHMLSDAGHCFQYRPLEGTNAANWKDILWGWLEKKEFVSPHPYQWSPIHEGKKWDYPLRHQYFTNAMAFVEKSWKTDGMCGAFYPELFGEDITLKKPLPEDFLVDLDFQAVRGAQVALSLGAWELVIPSGAVAPDAVHRLTIKMEFGRPSGFVGGRPIPSDWFHPTASAGPARLTFRGRTGEGYGKFHNLRILDLSGKSAK